MRQDLIDHVNRLDRLEEAEPLVRRVLRIDEKVWGPAKIATDLNNLALLLYETDRLVEAEPLMRRALSLAVSQRKQGGGRHSNEETFAENHLAMVEAKGLSKTEIDRVFQAVGTQAPQP